MTILVQVMNSCSVEGGRSSNDPMDLCVFGSGAGDVYDSGEDTTRTMKNKYKTYSITLFQEQLC